MQMLYNGNVNEKEPQYIIPKVLVFVLIVLVVKSSLGALFSLINNNYGT